MSAEKAIQIVVTGRRGAWVVRTPDGRSHLGKTPLEAMTTAVASEKARRERIVR